MPAVEKFYRIRLKGTGRYLDEPYRVWRQRPALVSQYEAYGLAEYVAMMIHPREHVEIVAYEVREVVE